MTPARVRAVEGGTRTEYGMRSTRGGVKVLVLLLTPAAVLALRPVLGAASRPGPLRSPGLRFEAPEGGVDLGIFEPGEAREVDVPWRRDGPGLLRVRAVHTGCGCLGADGLAGVLPEGAEGNLRVRLAGRTKPGPFDLGVRVFTDAAPPADLTILRIRGYVGRCAVCRPTALDLGVLGRGAEVERRIEVSIPPGWEAETISARLQGLLGRAVLERPMVRRGPGADVVVRIRAPGRPGPFAGALGLRVGVRAAFTIHVRGEVAPLDSEGRR